MSPSPLPSSRRIRIGLLIAALGIHALLAWLEWKPAPRLRVGDELRYLERAHHIAAGEAPPPDLLWPPLYSTFLAVFAPLGRAERAAIVLAQGLLLLGSALILRDLARRWAGPGLHADLAAFWLFASPSLAAYAYYLWPEALHLALFLACVWILAARRSAWPWQLGLGVLLGLALLTKSLLTGFAPVLLAPFFFDRPRRQGLAGLCRVGLACLLTVLPTVISHGRSTGSYVIADSSRFNLWLGLTDPKREEAGDRRVAQAYGDFQASGTTHEERNRVSERKIRSLLADQGLPATLAAQLGKQPFRLLTWHSALTDQLPGGRLFERGRGYQVGSSTLATLLLWTSRGFHLALLLLAPLGFLLVAARSRVGWRLILLAFLAYNAALFLMLHVTPRYLLQVGPALAMGASFAVSSLVWDRPRLEQLSIRGWIVALLLGLLLLGISLGA